MEETLAQTVKLRARSLCEYCLLPQKYRPLAHQFDHIIAVKHRERTTTADLAMACFACNLHQGTNLSGVDPQTRKVVRLFDPRRQNWKRHFRWQGAQLVGKTQCGRATVRTLRIDLPIRVAFRQSLIDIGEFPPSDAP
jgi:HNH endonuclease